MKSDKLISMLAGVFTLAAASLLVAVFFLPFSNLSAAPSEPEVSVAGVRIVGDGYGTDPSNSLRPFSWSKGTSMALMVKVPGGGIISFDNDASKLSEVKDDKGTDLLKSESSWSRSGFSMMAGISSDGTVSMPEFDAPQVPAKGAKEISVSGTLVFNQAREKKIFKQENLKLNLGSKITAGPVAFEITEVKKPAWGDAQLEVNLHAEQDVGALAGVRFLDAQGAEIKSETGMTGTSSMMGKVTVDKSFYLHQKVESATIELTYWMDMKQVSLPFTVKTSVGLS